MQKKHLKTRCMKLFFNSQKHCTALEIRKFVDMIINNLGNDIFELNKNHEKL